jgi:choline dehydrogenase-like flavoprotein
MVSDENTGTVWVDETGRDRYTFDWSPREETALAASLKFAAEVLEAAGARRVFHTGPLSTHMQGSCRMGSDPARSVVDAHGESHDVRRLFVGDGSVLPRTLSVNPSLTIMALASRLAQYIDADERGYLSGTPAAAVA